MKTVTARRLIAVACLGAFAIIGTACLPTGVTLPPVSPGAGAACPVGTWNLTGETIGSALQTVLGSATVTGSGSGVTLEITSTNTWTLTTDQGLQISGSNFAVNATVSATATGTNTTNTGAGTITFTLGNASGTVAASGNVGGQAFSGSWPLGQSGGIENLYALTGTANYTCNAGALTLSLPAVQMNFAQ